MIRNGRLWVVLAFIAAILMWWLALSSPERNEEPVAAAAIEPAPIVPAPAPARAPAVEPAPVAPAPAPPPPPSPTPEPPPVASDQTPTVPDPLADHVPVPPDTRGFIDALEERFQKDPRDSAATEVESSLRKLFRGPRMPAGLLRSVLCRQSVCKLEIYYVPQHDVFYHGIMAKLGADNAKFLATRAGEADARGGIRVEAYWLRQYATLPE
jgi:hypothetical protein